MPRACPVSHPTTGVSEWEISENYCELFMGYIVYDMIHVYVRVVF